MAGRSETLGKPISPCKPCTAPAVTTHSELPVAIIPKDCYRFTGGWGHEAWRSGAGGSWCRNPGGHRPARGGGAIRGARPQGPVDAPLHPADHPAVGLRQRLESLGPRREGAPRRLSRPLPRALRLAPRTLPQRRLPDGAAAGPRAARQMADDRLHAMPRRIDLWQELRRPGEQHARFPDVLRGTGPGRRHAEPFAARLLQRAAAPARPAPRPSTCSACATPI